ncbi:hypothetical protein Tco_0378842 [Tanacetum coccineum]
MILPATQETTIDGVSMQFLRWPTLLEVFLIQSITSDSKTKEENVTIKLAKNLHIERPKFLLVVKVAFPKAYIRCLIPNLAELHSMPAEFIQIPFETDEVIAQLGSKTIVAPPIEYVTFLLDQSAKVEFLPSLLKIKKMVPLILQQVVGMMADPKEMINGIQKKLKEMESERSGSQGNTSMKTPNNSNNGLSLKKIEIEADKDQVTVIVSCRIDTYPIWQSKHSKKLR